MAVPLFPSLPGIAWPVKWSPLWSSSKQTAISGKTTRLQLWSSPKRKYELTFEFLRSAEWQTLVGFYNTVLAWTGVFQFNDVDDCAVTAQPFGLGDGVTTTFQLVRGLGGFAEPVQCPTGAPVVMVNGAVTTPASIGSTGIVTFATAPPGGAALTWSGTYNWYCSFDDDQLDFDKFAYQFWELKSCKFTTEKL